MFVYSVLSAYDLFYACDICRITNETTWEKPVAEVAALRRDHWDAATAERLRDNDATLPALLFDGVYLGVEGARAVADCIRRNTNLTELVLEGTVLARRAGGRWWTASKTMAP